MPPKAAKPKSAKAPSTSSDGYTEVKERIEVAGYWNPEQGPLHGKLIDAYQFIQKSGKGRGGTRTVFVFDLADPCPARVKLEGGGTDETMLEPRELCGVFGSVGLRQLVTLAGCFIRLERLGKKTLGNGNEMWHFSMKYKGSPKALDVRPPFAGSSDGPTNGASREPGDDTESDELPF